MCRSVRSFSTWLMTARPMRAAEIARQVEQAGGVLDPLRRQRAERNGVGRHHREHHADAAQDLRQQQFVEIVVAW